MALQVTGKSMKTIHSDRQTHSHMAYCASAVGDHLRTSFSFSWHCWVMCWQDVLANVEMPSLLANYVCSWLKQWRKRRRRKMCYSKSKQMITGGGGGTRKTLWNGNNEVGLFSSHCQLCRRVKQMLLWRRTTFDALYCSVLSSSAELPLTGRWTNRLSSSSGGLCGFIYLSAMKVRQEMKIECTLVLRTSVHASRGHHLGSRTMIKCSRVVRRCLVGQYGTVLNC